MRKNRILLVDDEEAICFGVRDFLESHGFEVTEAESCAGAQEAFRAHKPQCAVLDYRLPDGDALELVPLLKKIDDSVPLLLLTGHGDRSCGARAGEAFVDLNCAGLTREFRETEMFRHEKGPFTGAIAAKQGLLETAHRGTVFLGGSATWMRKCSRNS